MGSGLAERQPTLSRRTGLTFLAPALALVVVFLVLPSVWVLAISVTDEALLGETAAHPSFVGLQNFGELFQFSRWMFPGQFGWSLRLSTLFTFGSVLGQAALGLALAWAFHRRRGVVRETFVTLVILAWIVPDVVVAFSWLAFLNRDSGTLNLGLALLHLGRVDWLLGHPLASILMFNIWRGTAFSLLLFSGALGTIPNSYLETAGVLGAGPWRTFRDIVLPLIRGHIFTDLILITLWTFNTFTPFLITAGGPAFKTDVVPIYVWRTALNGSYELGRGSAVAVIMLLLNLLLALFYVATLRRQRKIA